VVQVVRTIAILLSLWGVIYISHAFDYLRYLGYKGITITPNQHEAIFLASVLTLSFLLYPAKKGSNKIEWYNWLFVILGVVPNVYVVFFYDIWQLHAGTSSTLIEVILCIALIVALLEGLRRVLGIALPIVTLFFVIHPLISNYLPGILFGRGYSFERITTQFFLPSGEGIFGMPLEIAATIVIAFLLFGQMFMASGGGETIMNLALSVVGHVRGGSAKAAVVASGLFGTLSGSPASNVATTGTFTIPMMKKLGYSPQFAAGVEASASNGGQLLPPVMGVAAFVMAEMLRIKYVEVCYVAFIPAILYYIFIFLQVDFEAGRKRLSGLPISELPSFKGTVKNGYIHLIPVVVLIYFLFFLRRSPELSAFWATVSIVLVTMLRQKTRLSFGKIANALEETGKFVVIVGLSCAMAGLMMGSVSLTAIALSISGNIVNFAGGNLFLLLLLAALASFIFGMGMTSIPCYIFVAIMVAPALEQMGIRAITAHLFVFWLAIASFITPPVCLAAYVAAAISKTSPMLAGVYATRLGVGNFIIPFAFIYNPGLVINDTPLNIVLVFTITIIGIFSIAAGLEGYLFKRLIWWQRVLLSIIGVVLFLPVWWIRFLFLGILIPFMILQFRNRNDYLLSEKY
jgi:TRAP transporter 4TM/12TM fusion protein